MHSQKTICAILAASILVTGCSTRPRNFAASVSTPVADHTAFESDYRTCDTLVKNGRKTGFRDAAITGLATGGATVGAGALAVASGGGVNIATGAVSTSFAAMPFVGILAGFGVSRAIRGGKEKKLKLAMADCLAEYGYSVNGWTKLKRREDAAQAAANWIATDSDENSQVIVPSEPASSDSAAPADVSYAAILSN